MYIIYEVELGHGVYRENMMDLKLDYKEGDQDLLGDLRGFVRGVHVCASILNAN
jgi:hypothetical protein